MTAIRLLDAEKSHYALPFRTVWPGPMMTDSGYQMRDLVRDRFGLAALVQTQIDADPFSGQLFVFRGRRGDRIKALWWDGDGLCLYAKRLERGRFVWPQAQDGTVHLTSAQLSMLLEGIDWRRPERTAQKLSA
jgi:transposase